MTRQDLAAVLAPPDNQSLAVDIAARLREAILHGYFGPRERLREEQLARAMGVSRGPIREALLRLEREGLVVIRRNRGAFVAQLSREDLDEVYTLRVALERLAVQRAICHVNSDVLAKMQTLIATMADAVERGISEQEAADLDIRFHDLIYQGSNHRRLYECWTNLRPQIHILLLNRNVAHEDFRQFVVIGHQDILNALQDRNEQRALDVIEDHLRGSYERAVAIYEQWRTLPTGPVIGPVGNDHAERADHGA